MSRNPTLSEVILTALDARLEGLHTCAAGRVVRYDRAKQLADVQPLVKQAYENESGERVAVALPVITNCPVVFATGGRLSVTVPLEVGDTGLVVFTQHSLDKWLERGGDLVDPEVDHRHNLTDGVFIAGLSSFSKPRPAPPSNAIAVGDLENLQGAALGDDVHAQLERLRARLEDIASHAVYSFPPTSVPITSIPPVSSDDVKIS